jgi:RNA polymerase-binding protein DksA
VAGFGFGPLRDTLHAPDAGTLRRSLWQWNRESLAVRKVDLEVAQERKNTSRKQVTATRKKKTSLTTGDLETFKQMLLQKRREILRNVNEFADEALKKSRLDASGDLSSMPIHMADLGTDNYEQEFALSLMDSERKLLKEIDDALVRIEHGTYGICEGTSKPILKARLKAQPWARYCVDYARMLEKGIARGQ